MCSWKESRKKALSLYEMMLGVNGLAGLALSGQGLTWYLDTDKYAASAVIPSSREHLKVTRDSMFEVFDTLDIMPRLS